MESLTKNQRWALIGALWVVILIVILNVFFVWEEDKGESASRTILYESVTDTFIIDGNLEVDDIISGGNGNGVDILKDMIFVDENGIDLYKVYVEGNSTDVKRFSPDLDDVLVFETTSIINGSSVSMLFYDNMFGRPSLVLNQATSSRASVFENSLLVGIGAMPGNGTSTLDSTYTLCSTYAILNIDCVGDLFVADDIEVGGQVFSDNDYLFVSLDSTESVSATAFEVVPMNTVGYEGGDMTFVADEATTTIPNTGIYAVSVVAHASKSTGLDKDIEIGMFVNNIESNGCNAEQTLAKNNRTRNIIFQCTVSLSENDEVAIKAMASATGVSLTREIAGFASSTAMTWIIERIK